MATQPVKPWRRSPKQKAYKKELQIYPQEQTFTGEIDMAMVDVSDKAEIFREATATGTIKLKPETIRLNQGWKNREGRPALHGEDSWGFGCEEDE